MIHPSLTIDMDIVNMYLGTRPTVERVADKDLMFAWAYEGQFQRAAKRIIRVGKRSGLSAEQVEEITVQLGRSLTRDREIGEIIQEVYCFTDLVDRHNGEFDPAEHLQLPPAAD